ncbi:hypothetical protein PBY51_019410 [Eleginops maclovinus]|nr:hypothetical protein PBY51_019410 [Eleginops maclovinus]
MSGVDLHMETSEGGLKELVLKWFTETQAPLIVNNGNFPDWFQGFVARKDTEDLLRDKAQGCFLIRLSDKAIGYILSYKGHDRCRHFVITENQDGQFVIAGDCQTYNSLTELIEHFKVSPIQPFGEYLTTSFNEVSTGELYDVVNYTKGKSGVSVQALRTLWDQKQRIQQQNDPRANHPPAMPLKPKNRKLTGVVSVDTVTLSQGVPPLPKRGIPLGFSLSGSFPETASHPSETSAEANRSARLRGKTNQVSDRDSFSTSNTSYPGDLSPPGITYSELTQVGSRSISLPRLNSSNLEEEEEEEEEEEKEEKEREEEKEEKKEEYSNRLSMLSLATSKSYSPTPLKKVTCHTYSLHKPRDSPRPSRSEQQGGDLEMFKSNPMYHTLEGPGGASALKGDNMYAEVPNKLPDDTYEQIPGEAAFAGGDMYESLEELKTNQSKSTWGKNNIIWKRFFPDNKK